MKNQSRRNFLKSTSAVATGGMIASHLPLLSCAGNTGQVSGGAIKINLKPLFDLSPYLYMQFMEPLGVTDSSVDAAWDFMNDRWREDLVEITKELAPTLIRWGGCFVSYYRWKEGIGPMKERKPMINQLWGGIYNNQVGTHEFADFCHQVGADPLICVNFESDGRMHWANPPKGGSRLGDAKEAAEWVDYCNNPSNALRLEHGHPDPYNIKLWQLGNETSYDPNGMDCDTACRKTIEFTTAMRERDPEIQFIGWGDSGWAKPLYEKAGEHLQYLAFHNGYGPGGEDSPLRGIEYRKDWDETWEYFMESYKQPEKKILEMREETDDLDIPLAITEGHFFLPGRNRCEALSTWAAAVSNARILNMFERNGDKIKIATMADFCGTRWQNNAVMMPVPGGQSFLMPVAMIMQLYRKHTGNQFVEVAQSPGDLDITANRTENKLFLHVVNTSKDSSVRTSIEIAGTPFKSGRSFTIALDPAYEVFEHKPEITNPKEEELAKDGSLVIPAASVSAIEIAIL
ncbi:MAG: alpha-L-arabinofuranosidase [Bacteroidales bacterium]|nr:alpha-L-arabinofuranosidase [Bacteroidales bacterium]